MMARMHEDQHCPSCGSTDLASIETAAMDSELLQCQNCRRAYEVKFSPDGSVKLVAV